MTDSEIKVGDIVRLKSGGVPMVVEGIVDCESGLRARCIFQTADPGDVRSICVPFECLVRKGEQT